MYFNDHLRKDGIGSGGKTFYINMYDHWPHIDMNGGGCNAANLGVSFGAVSLGTSVTRCDTFDQHVWAYLSAKRNKFYTGFVGENGKDVEVVHMQVNRTYQRPWNGYAPRWRDDVWATFCGSIHLRCTRLAF